MAASSSSSSNSNNNDGLSLLQTALTSWTKFNLPERRPQLESTAQSLLEAKETSLVARKQLGEFTKSLKRALKSAEDELLSSSNSGSIATLATETKSTIKHYQSEIDALTRRCKLAETTFLQLYHSLYECCCFDDIDDLSIVFEQAIQLLTSKDDQLNNLLRGMEELNDELELGNEEKIQLQGELKEMERQLNEALKKGGGAKKSDGGGAADGNEGGGALSLAEREELIRLRSEVAEYEVEFRGLKNQDITIRKLESKIEELEQNREEEIQKELKKAQEELAESEGRRAAEALEREAITSRKLESVELQLRAERAGREASANQLLKAEDGLGEREAAWEAQRQILVQDAERLREELSEMGRERDTWRLKIEAMGKSPISGSSGYVVGDGAPPSSGAVLGSKLAEYLSERKAYEAEIVELSVTCNALREEVRVKEESISEERRSLRMSIDALERERSFLANQVTALEMKVASAPSQDAVDKMRHELRILKRLEYNAVDFDHRDIDPEMTHPDNLGKEDDLESVLVAKLRKVEADLVRERREKCDGNKERDELKQKLNTVQTSLLDAEALVASLENDLQRAVATPTKPNRSALSDVPFGSTEPPNPNTLQRILDPKAPPTSNPLPVPSATATAEEAHDDHSVATIVMAQRDRLRVRCDTLEMERDSFKRELQIQVEAAEALKTDNAKLYEKVRYLQSFNGGGNSKGGMRGRGSERNLDLEALEQRYEASVDPFRQFSRAERQRKFNEMSPMEKIVFIVAKTTLGSKEMRTALFFYVLAMHLLVFVTTYHWSHSSTCGSLHSHEALAHFHGGIPFENAPNASIEFANSSVGTD
ncbi:hypothetical protein ACHAXH_009834 [Discostella pseudostelligera]